MNLNQVGCIIVASTILWEVASAAHLKCGNKYVHKGDTENEVIQKCGQPFHTSRGGRNWYFEQSRGTFVREIIFNEHGKVMQINMVNPGT